MAIETLPRWSLDRLFPSVEGPEYGAAVESVVRSLADLGALMDARGVDPGDSLAVTPQVVAALEEVLAHVNDLSEEMRRVLVYPTLLAATDTRNEGAKARLSEVQTRLVGFETLMKRFTAWVGSLDVEALIAASPLAAAHAYPLRHMHEAARHLMSQPEEDLATQLNLASGRAWNKLWIDLSSQAKVEVTLDGERRTVPMTVARRLATNPDPAVRQSAYEGELRAWESLAVPMAACLNSVKGEVITLARRRGWADPLEATLFQSRIDRPALDAMLEAVVESFPDFRRYLRAKARLLGRERLSWHDLLAPVGQASRLSWDEAREMVVGQFGSYSPRMQRLALRAFDENWVDAAPAPAKREGAFCSLILPGESRVLLTFEPSLNSASTLAHELGHAYHNLNLAERTPIQRQTPMVLAETASTFCETIVTTAAKAVASPPARLSLLEAELQRDTGIVVDCYARFVFEQRVFERRAARDLAPGEIVELMAQAQREAYGDGLDDRLHPHLWAAKPHFYSTGLSYYNFPYIFALLFGLGLYAHYVADPHRFRGAYDDLLSSTGLDDAATLAARFGLDIRAPHFWRSSLDVVRANVAEFERLAAP